MNFFDQINSMSSSMIAITAVMVLLVLTCVAQGLYIFTLCEIETKLRAERDTYRKSFFEIERDSKTWLDKQYEVIDRMASISDQQTKQVKGMQDTIEKMTESITFLREQNARIIEERDLLLTDNDAKSFAINELRNSNLELRHVARIP